MMADDNNRPSSERQASWAHEASSVPVTPAPVEPLPGEDDAIPAREPSMAAGAADFAAPDRQAEAFAPVGAAPRRSLMPTLLALIGAILIVLLAVNLYMLAHPPENDALPALQSEVAGLKQRLGAVDLAPLDGRVTQQATDIATLKSAVERNSGAAGAGVVAQAALAPLDGKVSDLAQRVGALGDTLAALPKVDLAPLNTRIADLDKRVLPLEAYLSAPKATDRVTEVRQNGSAAQSRAAPVAVIAQAIQGAVAAGRPFGPEVKALANLGLDDATLKPLQAVATTGAATTAALVEGFAAVQDAIVVAAAPVSTGTMFDRMMANATSIVKVTRTGAGTGTEADATASRIAADLKAGDLKGAAAEWDKLPAVSQARADEWAARLKARIAADEAARSIAVAAVDALAAAP